MGYHFQHRPVRLLTNNGAGCHRQTIHRRRQHPRRANAFWKSPTLSGSNATASHRVRQSRPTLASSSHLPRTPCLSGTARFCSEWEQQSTEHAAHSDAEGLKLLTESGGHGHSPVLLHLVAFCPPVDHIGRKIDIRSSELTRMVPSRRPVVWASTSASSVATGRRGLVPLPGSFTPSNGYGLGVERLTSSGMSLPNG